MGEISISKVNNLNLDKESLLEFRILIFDNKIRDIRIDLDDE